MKINISNLGVIKNAQIELKPLTVFVGENGTGKTWAAYAIAGLLGPYGHKKYLEAYLNDKTDVKFQALEDSIQALFDKGTATLNLKEFLISHAEDFINETAKLIPQWLGIFMATKRVNFDAAVVSVKFTPDILDKVIETSNNSKVTAEFSIGKKTSPLLSLNALKEKNKDELYFYIISENKEIDSLPDPVKNKEIRKFVISVLFDAIHRSVLSNTRVFPSERTAFISINADSSRIKSEQDNSSTQAEKTGDELGNLVLFEPVKSFLAMLRSSMRGFFEISKEEQEYPEVNNFIKLSDFFENEILLGRVDFEDYGSYLELLYSPQENTNLELNVSSSMIKELAPLSLYLRYLANPNDLLVIDEPETNLHPSAQMEITEFMGMLVNSGLKLLITTHSPYILDHLENLMKAYDFKNKSDIKTHFLLEREDAFVSQNDISVYLFEDGNAKDLISEDGEIDWDTFNDVSRSMSEIYSCVI